MQTTKPLKINKRKIRIWTLNLNLFKKVLHIKTNSSSKCLQTISTDNSDITYSELLKQSIHTSYFIRLISRRSRILSWSQDKAGIWNTDELSRSPGWPCTALCHSTSSNISHTYKYNSGENFITISIEYHSMLNVYIMIQ